ncbi:MAG: LptE family protein [Bacteroidota bacterium]|nr:LptE family protein [Bacteroidota bacterium]
MQKLINNINRYKILIVLFLITVSSACTIKYSTTGASISPDVKTVSVQFFPNRAPLGMPNLGQYFTDELKDKFLSQTSLSLIENNGHLNFEGEITGYSTKPIAITGNEVAAQNRLTIKVHVVFINEKDPDQNFDSSFSRYKDYNSTENLSSVEEGLVEDIVEELMEDIFNKSVVNW